MRIAARMSTKLYEMPQPLSSAANLPVPVELVARRIYLIRRQRVMLDNDLAELYEVPTKSLNLAVPCNRVAFRKTSCSSSTSYSCPRTENLI